jgi:hypothetical protein
MKINWHIPESFSAHEYWVLYRKPKSEPPRIDVLHLSILGKWGHRLASEVAANGGWAGYAPMADVISDLEDLDTVPVPESISEPGLLAAALARADSAEREVERSHAALDAVQQIVIRHFRLP